MSRRTRHALAAVFISMSCGAQAEGPLQDFYLGLRGGASYTGRDDQNYLRDLIERGHQVQIIAVDTADSGGTLYGGYRFAPQAAIELGYVLLGQFNAAVYAPTSDPLQLARDAVELQPDAGDAVSLSLRRDVPLWRGLSATVRLGGFYWWQDSTIHLGDERIDADRDGYGLTVGGGLDWALSPHWALGIGGDLYRTSSREPVKQVYAQLEYRF